MTARVAAALLGIVAAAVAGLAVMIGREPGGIRLAAPSVTASAAPGPASRPPELVTLPPDAAPPPPPPRTATARNEDRPAPPPPRESPHPKPEVRAEIRRIQADLDRARPDEKPPLIEKLGGIVDLIVAEILKFYVMGFEVQGVPALTQQVRLAAAKALGKMRDPNNPAVAARAAAILMEACDERFNKKEK